MRYFIVIFFVNSFLSPITCSSQELRNVYGLNDTLKISLDDDIDSAYFQMTGGLKKKFIHDNNFWAAEIFIKDLDSALFSYNILYYKAGKRHKLMPKNGDNRFLWYGKAVGPYPEKNNKISGQILFDTVYSKSLDSKRSITLYLPPGYNKGKDYPIVYATDGEDMVDYYPYVDYLIDKKIIEPIVIVGENPNNTIVDSSIMITYRAFEYTREMYEEFPNVDKRIFKKHEDFFLDELPVFIENRYRISKKNKKRILFGFSNGAAFGLIASMDEPNKFSDVLAFSPMGVSTQELNKNSGNEYPHFYLMGGEYEYDQNSFTITKLADRFNELHIYNNYKIFRCGHDDYLWKFYFINCLKKIFGK